MIRAALFGLAAAGLAVAPAATAAQKEKEARLYELRVYYAAPGKLDDLHARFRDHTLQLFEKHGMTNVGYWVPVANPDNKLVYVLSYSSAAARAQSWAAFQADPEWQKAKKDSEVKGKLVDRVDETYLRTTDYSPAVKAAKADASRIFELRTYTTTPGNLGNLHARFRDHTVKLFEKHGMTNLWYWTLAPQQKGADATLVYMLAHPSAAARDKSFAEFRADPDWQAALKASEQKAGGSLTVKDGVKSELLTPTDYSPIK